jgi:hypothetical protein
VVRKAKNRETNQYCAVKVLSKRKMSEEDIDSLKNEL